MGDKKWQVLKIVVGILFLLAAVMLVAYGPQGRNTRIGAGLMAFLGVFYIISSIILARLFRKMGQG